MSHLSDEQLHGLKHKLEDERQRLRADIRDELLKSDAEQYSDLAGSVPDTGDAALADLLSDLNTAVLGRSIKELREVEAALERIKEGVYGRCEDCAVEIPLERLEVNPAARRCTADQERHEKFYQTENKPSL